MDYRDRDFRARGRDTNSDSRDRYNDKRTSRSRERGGNYNGRDDRVRSYNGSRDSRDYNNGGREVEYRDRSPPNKHGYPEDPSRVYCSRLPLNTNPDELKKLFEDKVGPVEELFAHGLGPERDYVFIKFKEEKDAAKAIQTMNYHPYLNSILRVQKAYARKPSTFFHGDGSTQFKRNTVPYINFNGSTNYASGRDGGSSDNGSSFKRESVPYYSNGAYIHHERDEASSAANQSRRSRSRSKSKSRGRIPVSGARKRSSTPTNRRSSSSRSRSVSRKRSRSRSRSRSRTPINSGKPSSFVGKRSRSNSRDRSITRDKSSRTSLNIPVSNGNNATTAIVDDYTPRTPQTLYGGGSTTIYQSYDDYKVTRDQNSLYDQFELVKKELEKIKEVLIVHKEEIKEFVSLKLQNKHQYQCETKAEFTPLQSEQLTTVADKTIAVVPALTITEQPILVATNENGNSKPIIPVITDNVDDYSDYGDNDYINNKSTTTTKISKD